MSDVSPIGARVTFRELFERDQHGLVQIPIIQRDYAQGRSAENGNKERVSGCNLSSTKSTNWRLTPAARSRFCIR
jgi:hypothetical protein